MAKKKYEPTNIVEVADITYTIMCVDISEGIVRTSTMNIASYVQKVVDGEVCRDVLVQRLEGMWSKKKNSDLILSILYSRPIGNILVTGERMNGQMYQKCSLMDGLQRTTAIVGFVTNKYALPKNLKPVKCRCKNEDGDIIVSDIDIAGKKFEQLPPCLQQTILNYDITLHWYIGFTDEELDRIIYNVNSGTAFKANQKLRLAFGTKAMKVIQPICESIVWEDADGCNSKNDSILGCIVRSMMLVTNYDFKNLGANEMSNFVEDFDINSSFDSKTVDRVNELFEQFETVMTSRKLSDDDKAFFNACNIPHIITNIDEFNYRNNGDMTMEDYVDFLADFIHSDNKLEYDKCAAVKSGSGGSQYSAENVLARQSIINNALIDYIALKNASEIFTAKESECNESEITESDDEETIDTASDMRDSSIGVESFTEEKTECRNVLYKTGA